MRTTLYDHEVEALIIDVDTQRTMQMLIRNLHPEDKKHFQTSVLTYLPVNLWPGLFFSRDQKIESIGWTDLFKYPGELDVQHIPESVTLFAASNCHLKSFGKFKDSPSNLKYFHVANNDLSGKLDLQNLPRSLCWLDVSKNKYSGKISFADLPRSITEFSVQENSLSGEVDFTHFPSGGDWIKISLSHNQFYGPIDLSKLPHWTRQFDIRGNFFTGEFDFTKLPKEIYELDIEDNMFDALRIGFERHDKLELASRRDGFFADWPYGMKVRKSKGRLIFTPQREIFRLWSYLVAVWESPTYRSITDHFEREGWEDLDEWFGYCRP